MTKRILIFTTAYFPLVGGAEIAIKEITDRLTDFEFDLICAKIKPGLRFREKIGNINVFRLGFGLGKLDKLYLALFGCLKALKLHRKRPYDLIWSVMASYGAFSAVKVKEKTGLKLLLTLQEGDALEETLNKVKLIKGRFGKIFKAADGLQAISQYLLKWGLKMGFPGRLSEVVPNGVDVGLFAKEYPKEEILALRKSLGFADQAVIMVTASRLAAKNGVGDVIQALKQLPEHFCFYICGNGELEKKLKKLTNDLGLEKRVKFAGYQSHESLPKILKASDIFIRPSISEGLGNAFLEAMAAGLPTIGTLVGGIPDFLKDGETGLVCEPKNSASIAQAILRASQLTLEERIHLHQNAMKLINEKYNWEYIAPRLRHIFKELTI